jgi:hypothetical protein
MAEVIKARRLKEKMRNVKDPSEKIHEMKKGVGTLSRMEKRKLYGGDKTIMYEKLGLIEEQDVERYKRKLGIKKDTNLEEVDIDVIL